MKVILLLALLFQAVVAQSPTATAITTAIKGLYNGNTLLDATKFNSANSYQSRALSDAVRVLAGTGAGTLKITEYYALVCLYYSSNAVANPRTNSIIPGQKLPNWARTTNWINAANYCTWFGIKCKNAGSLVTDVILYNNTLTGELPDEISLLGSSLDYLDLGLNFYHWKGTFDWMTRMTVLQYLAVGTTSFDSDGIPTQIASMKKLIELDFSNTFIRGKVTPAAFSGLNSLRLLDMADNLYVAGGANVDLPSTISGLPSLLRFYMDNVQFTDSGRFNLNFIGSMPKIVETWHDFTKFTGGIPTTVGRATTLQSLSLSYCGLTGNIPSELAKTKLDRMWLFANKLTGTIPTVLSQRSWLYLYFEENGITGTVPTGICNQKKAGTLKELGANCAVCPSGCCTCCGNACGNILPTTLAPTAAPTTGGFCFSGDSEVQVENKGLVKMNDLAIGDNVRVSANTFEPVYSFGHKNADASAEFLQIITVGYNKPLEVSRDHMVVVEGGRNIPASMVKRGDNLVTADGNLVAVKNVRTVVRKGVYAPFTDSGSIIVNDVAASNYVAFQGSEYVKIAGVQTPFSYQWLAHTFNSVHRLAVKMGVTGESYTETGLSMWIYVPHKVGTWMLEQNAFVMLAFLLPSVAFFGSVSLIESLINSPMLLASIIVGAVTIVVARRNVAVKMVKV